MTATPTGLAIPADFGRGLANLYQLRNGKTLLMRLIENDATLDYGILRVAASVVDQETVKIGNTTYIVEELNTAITGLTSIQISPTNAAGQSATSKTINLLGATQALVPGDVILAGSEFELITGVLAANWYTVVRGWAGSTAATHATSATMKMAATPGVSIAAGKILVPMTATLTNTVFVTHFVAVVNAIAEGLVTAGAFVGYVPADTKNAANLVAVAVTTAIVMVMVKQRGSFAYATTETLSGSGNVWDAATMSGGFPPERTRQVAIRHTCSSGDVTAGTLFFPHDFAGNPSCVIVQVRDSTGVSKAWDGAAVLTAPVSGAVVPDVQTIAITGGTPTLGTFHIVLTDDKGVVYTTGEIAFNASAFTVQKAIEAVLGGWEQAPNVEVSGGPGPGTAWVVTFDTAGLFAGLVTALTTADTGMNNGASSGVTHTTSGAAATTPVPGYIAIDNSGATDWANTDVINILLAE